MPKARVRDADRILAAAKEYCALQQAGKTPKPTPFLMERGLSSSRSTFYKRVAELKGGDTVLVRPVGRPTVFDGPQERRLAQYAYASAFAQEPMVREDWRKVVSAFADLNS